MAYGVRVDVVLLLGERGERRRDLVGGAQRGHVERLPLQLGRGGLRHGGVSNCSRGAGEISSYSPLFNTSC